MRRLYPEVATTRGFEDLLNGADLDAVVIATPVRFHYELAKARFERGQARFHREADGADRGRGGRIGGVGRTRGPGDDGGAHVPVLPGGAAYEGDRRCG